MSDLSNIVKKELREMFTMATIGATILIIVMFSVIGQAQAGLVEEAKKKPVIGIINADNGPLSGIVTAVLNSQAEVVYSSTSISDLSEGLREVEEGGGTALLAISPDFSENVYENRPGQIQTYWILRGLGVTDTVPSQVISGLIQVVEQEISKKLVEEGSPVNPEVVINPIEMSETTIFRGVEMENLPPGALTGVLSSQSYIISIVVMMVIATGGGTVIASMGMEKENKTLETLLTLPVKRNNILMGKILAGVIYGFVIATVYMVALAYYMQSPQALGAAGVNLANFGLVLSLQDYLLIGVSIFLALLVGFSMCMVLGIFAKNYKSAENFLFPVMILAMVPMFLSMFMDFNTLPLALKVLMFAIPFSHPMMAVRALMFDDYLLVLGGILYVAIFAAVMVSIGVWIFKSDRLLTAGAGAGKWRARLLRGFFGRRGR